MTSLLGTDIFTLTMLWEVHILTRGQANSTFLMSLVLVVTAIPKIFLKPIAGVYVDRWRKRRTLMLSDLLSGVLMTIVTFLAVAKALNTVELVVLSFLLSSVTTVWSPSLLIYRKQIIGKDQLLKANSLINTIRQVLTMVGPAVGGVLVGTVGVVPAFAFNTLSFFVSLLCLALIRHQEQIPVPNVMAGQSFLTEMKAGYQTFMSLPYTRTVTPFIVSYNFAVGAFEVLLIQFVSNSLHYGTHRGATIVGLLNTAMAIGELLGGLALPFLPSRWPKEWLFAFNMTFSSFTLFIIGLSKAIPLLSALMFIAGFSISMVGISFITSIQEAVPDESLGRVYSILGAMMDGAMPLSQLVFSAVATVLPVSGVISGIGALGVLTSSSSFLTPAIRNASVSVPETSITDSA